VGYFLGFGRFAYNAQEISMRDRSMKAAAVALMAVVGVMSADALAQTSPPASPAVPAKPNAETPPGGMPRGVVPPPSVDPGMVTQPPAAVTPTMPVIKPPAMAK